MAPRGSFPTGHDAKLAQTKYPDPKENLDDASSKHQYNGAADYNANTQPKDNYPKQKLAPRGSFPTGHDAKLAQTKYPDPKENLDDASSKHQYEGAADYNANTQPKDNYPKQGLAPRGGFPVSHSLIQKKLKYPDPDPALDDAKFKNQYNG